MPYTRTIGRQVSNVFPLWRRNMTVQDRLYNVSSNVPGVASGLVPNPLPNHFGVWSESPNFGSGEDVMSGYGSGTFLDGVGGAFGTMIYGTGGHTRLQNQILGLNLNQDAPTFFWWRQPEFQTSDTAGADLYYSPSEAAAIQAGPRGSVAVVNMSGGEGAFSAVWDGQFPVATTTGWVFPRRMNTGTLGNNAPHGYRYTIVCEVPARITGSDPCILVGGPRPQGPFALSEYPSGVNQALWFDPAARYPSGLRKWPFHLLNLRTGLWSIVGYWPDQATSGFQGPSFFADPARQRVWASVDGSNPGVMYVDFSGGLGAVTVSNITFASPGGSNARQANSSGALTVGHPSKLLWIWPNANNSGGLFIQDCLAGTTAAVDLTSKGLAVANHEKIGTTYDAQNNRVLIVQPINVSDPSQGIEYFSIPVPDNHTSAAAYTVTRRTLSVDPAVASLVTASGISEFYGKTRILPTLGNVILIPFSKGRMLGFIPAP